MQIKNLPFMGYFQRAEPAITNYGEMDPQEQTREPIAHPDGIQVAYDIPLQSLIPTRAARLPEYLAYHDQTMTQEDRFMFDLFGRAPRAWLPYGRQTPMGERSNIGVPAHLAYGSLFDMTEPTYGIG